MKFADDEKALVTPPEQTVCTWNSYVVEDVSDETATVDVAEVVFVQVDVPVLR